ncbi:MAG: NAD(P)H-hydrate dehydratase [Marinilabiliaceae bacterium]|nr:NAD(P)H-hydrate dehydratase [Marinilabiliaceae bacterium]
MKIFATTQVKELDKYTIDHEPILSIDLMERASRVLYNWISRHIKPSNMVVLCGSGNNGGDSLAVARMAIENGCNVAVYIIHSHNYSDNLLVNLDRLKSVDPNCIRFVKSENDFPDVEQASLILDGLFGSGLNRPVNGLAANLIRYINQQKVKIISIDVPSGLLGEDNSTNSKDAIIKATFTLSFQFPKLSFLFPENANFVGEWHVLDIGLHKGAIDSITTSWQMLTHDFVRDLIPMRKKFAHKGDFGHALLISGCYGKMGAAVLASKACLKTGVGLLTTHVPRLGYQIIQTSVPEAMVSIDRSDILFSEFPYLENYDAVAVGPGIGMKFNTQKALSELLKRAVSAKMVVDADAINILSENKNWLNNLPLNSILTPHPKEFERLVGSWSGDFDRLKKLIDFSKLYNVITVLKGAYTTIAMPDGTCYFNTTGNAGMATAGSGDVLTGIILSLLSQGLKPQDAAIVGVYIHGLAGDIYADEESEEALVASCIIEYLGKAFRDIRKIRYYHQ